MADETYAYIAGDKKVYSNTAPYPTLAEVGGDKTKLAESRSHYRAEQGKLNDQLRADLEAAHDMKGHPKADALWRMAWDQGHAHGFNEVAIYYEQFLELVR